MSRRRRRREMLTHSKVWILYVSTKNSAIVRHRSRGWRRFSAGTGGILSPFAPSNHVAIISRETNRTYLPRRLFIQDISGITAGEARGKKEIALHQVCPEER